MAKDYREYENVSCVIGYNENVCCVIGYTKDNVPIWKKVGVKTTAKSTGRMVILLDRTFNPAGVEPDSNSKNSVPLYFFPQDKITKTKREERQQREQNALDDFNDDIPF